MTHTHVRKEATPMTDTTPPVALTLPSGLERMFPTLTPGQVERIATHGHVRSIRAGEALVEPGEQIVPFFVVTAGRVEVVRPSGTAETSRRITETFVRLSSMLSFWPSSCILQSRC